MVRLLAQGTRYGRAKGSASPHLSAALASTRIAVTGYTRRMACRNLAARGSDADDLVSAAGSPPRIGGPRIGTRPAALHSFSGRRGGILVGRTADGPTADGCLQSDL